MKRPAPITERVARPAQAARAEELTAGIWNLRLPLCYREVSSVNGYLLATDEGFILFDCGSCLSPGWAAVEIALHGAGIKPADLTLLVISHSHADHRGLAAECVERTGCQLAMGPGPHPLIDVLRDPAIALTERRQRGARIGVPEIMLDALVDELPGDDGGYPAAEPDLTLRAGERLATKSGAWEVVPVPGHSADQIALWNRELRWLIGADLALPGEASYLEYGTRPDPHADQVASLECAIALDPRLLLAGHGPPRKSATGFLRGCRRKVLVRLARMRAQLDNTPQSVWEIAGAFVPAGASAAHWQRSMAETISVLEHLQAHEAARAFIADDGIERWLRA